MLTPQEERIVKVNKLNELIAELYKVRYVTCPECGQILACVSGDVLPYALCTSCEYLWDCNDCPDLFY